jgi:sulfotransferase
MKKFVFLAGLPRTGSTVLGTLLSQHPELKTTATSVVRGLMNYTLNLTLGQSLYYDRYDDKSELWGVLRGILNGAYGGYPQPVIVEKDRGWAKDIDVTARVIGETPKIIAPVRALPDIISSFILIAAKVGPSAKIYEEVTTAGREINSWSLSRIIWEKYVYHPWREMKASYEAYPECFHLVEYESLTNNSEVVMEKVYNFIGVHPVTVETENLSNPHPENDAVFGLPGLHYVRPKLAKVSPPAIDVLGKDCYQFWNKQGLEFWRG